MMKNSRLLSMAVFAILMVVMVSCTTIRDAGDYEDMSSRRRVYYEDPRYGNAIILERDPYTGQLYQISPFGYSSPFYNYGYGYRNNYPNNYNRGRYYNRGGATTKPRPTTPPRTETKRNFDDARSKVLGDKKQ